MNQAMIDQYREKIHIIWAQARRAEDRRLAGLKRLSSFPLWKRILLYSRFNKVRTIIRIIEERRSVAVMMALGGARQLRRMERKLREQDQSCN